MIWKMRMKIHNIMTSISGLKRVSPRYAARIKSFPYVSGETYTATWPIDGIASTGMKTPDIKMRGSLTMFSIDIISPGLSVGYAANRVPIVAKQNEVSVIPKIRGAILITGVPKRSIPAISGTNAIPML